MPKVLTHKHRTIPTSLTLILLTLATIWLLTTYVSDFKFIRPNLEFYILFSWILINLFLNPTQRVIVLVSVVSMALWSVIDELAGNIIYVSLLFLTLRLMRKK